MMINKILDILHMRPSSPLACGRGRGSVAILAMLCALGLPFGADAGTFPIDEAQVELQMAMEEKGLGKNIKIDSARFIFIGQNKQYDIDSIKLLKSDINYSIAEIQGRNNHFSATIAGGGGKVRVNGRYAQYIEIPVLNSMVRKGAIIKESDITWIEISARMLRNSVVTSDDEIVGKQAVRHIKASKPIHERHLSKPIAVKKNDMIAIIYDSQNISLKTTGIALEKASIGDVINIKNLKSGVILQAMVTRSGRAQINYEDIMFKKSKEFQVSMRGGK